MYPSLKTILLGSVICSAPLFASALEISITPFQTPAGILQDNNLRFLQTESIVPDTENDSTHILIHGFIPMDPATPTVVTSEYTGIAISSGDETDRGYVTLEMPATEPSAGVATSPVVGIVQRAGPWSDRTLSPVSTTVGEAAGTSSYTATAITFNLTKNSQAVTGTANYTTSGQNSITLAPFSLTHNGQTYDFEGVTLPLIDSDTFTGIIDVSNPPAAQLPDSAFFVLSITDSTDADSDGIPDIVDTNIIVDPADCTLFDTLFTGEFIVGLEGDFAYNWSEGDYYYSGFCPFLYDFANTDWWYVYDDGNNDPAGFFAFSFNDGMWYFIFQGYKLSL